MRRNNLKTSTSFYHMNATKAKQVARAKYRLSLQGKPALAKELGCSLQMLYAVLSGKSPSARLRAELDRRNIRYKKYSPTKKASAKQGV